MTVQILIGDCLVRMKELADNSIDSVVCDPPYHLTQSNRSKPPPHIEGSPFSRHRMGVNGDTKAQRGFMGQEWDGGDVAFRVETWAEVLRVLKPGGHLVAFSGTRTYHRMAVAIEDAGFEVRDMIAWHYGSGFPKSHDVAKGIDKAAGRLAAQSVGFNVAGKQSGLGTIQRPELRSDNADFQPYSPATDEARKWSGYGTALKPATEPICLARKPLSEKSIAANVLKWGTGALNIDGCRIDGEKGWPDSKQYNPGHLVGGSKDTAEFQDNSLNPSKQLGRWPANLCHDGSDEVVAGFPETKSPAPYERKTDGAKMYGGGWDKWTPADANYGDQGSAARFFYTAKASSEERGEGNNHPTVKPVSLMQWLVRLVTPKDGVCLDPFMGSGSTGLACQAEQMNFIGIELSQEYATIAERRMRDAAGLFADVKVAA